MKVCKSFSSFLYLLLHLAPQFPSFYGYFCIADRKPGDIEALTDFMLEDYKNFPKVPEFGEETASFIRQEMEDTWGSEHISVLPEDKAQHWILGVGTLYLLRTSVASPFKICKHFKVILHQLP